MSWRVEFNRFVSAASMTVLGVMLLCTPPVGAVGDQQAAEPNDLRWDLAENFEFQWTGVELSAKVATGTTYDPHPLTFMLTISGEFRVLDPNGLVTTEAERASIVSVSDADGSGMPWQFQQGASGRWYGLRDRQSDAEGQGTWWSSFCLSPLWLPDDPNKPFPSSLGVEAYLYVLYADEVISVDIPFDPNAGWYEPEATPGLQICLDPATPPCPGPLRYVPISPLPGTPKGFAFPYRPTTPVPLYRYTTWVRMTTGAPVMALRDRSSYYRRDIYPLGDYAILRTELYDSVRQKSAIVPDQETGSGVTDIRGTYCLGQMEQGRHDTYDTIRHVIVVHPVEVKVPFVLENITVPPTGGRL